MSDRSRHELVSRVFADVSGVGQVPRCWQPEERWSAVFRVLPAHLYGTHRGPGHSLGLTGRILLATAPDGC
jgi:hypothetical protein